MCKEAFFNGDNYFSEHYYQLFLWLSILIGIHFTQRPSHYWLRSHYIKQPNQLIKDYSATNLGINWDVVNSLPFWNMALI